MQRSRACRIAVSGVVLALALGARAAHAGTTTVYAAIDNRVSVSSSDPTVEQTVYGATDLGVGCNWELYFFDGVPYQAFFCARSLVWFDLGALIAGKTIERALLRVYPYLLPTSLGTTYGVAPVLTSWNGGTVRWSNQPSAGATVDVVGPPVTTALPMEFDVTSVVQDWADGTRVNYGFRLRDQNDLVLPYATLYRVVGIESLEYWYASGRRPQLHLEIADAPAPTLAFWADPPQIALGGSSTLRWQATNATTCFSNTPGWGSPFMSTAGSLVVSPIATKTYGLGCTGDGGAVSQSVTVTVPEPARAALAAALALVALRRQRGG